MEGDFNEEKYVAIEFPPVESKGIINQNELQLTTSSVPSMQSTNVSSNSDLNDINLNLTNEGIYEDTRIDFKKLNHEDFNKQSHQEMNINTQTYIHSDLNDYSRNITKHKKIQALAVSDDDLRCAICFQFLRIPKLLPCLHSFCLVCLEKLHNFSASANYPEVFVKKYLLSEPIVSKKEVTIKCPICDENCDLPLGGIEGLVTNTMLVNIIKSKERLTQQAQCEVCKQRDKIEDAVAFCTDCTCMLCKSCWQSHSFTRLTRTHKIVPLDQMEDHIHVEALRHRPGIKCDLHSNEYINYFCTDCRGSFCQECLLLGHQGHSCIPSSNLANARRNDLKTLMHGLKEKLDSLKREESKEYEAQMNRITTSENVELQKINSFCDNLITAIEKERQIVLEKTKSEFLKMSGHCKNRFVSFQNIEKKINSTMSVVNLVESLSSDEEVLLVAPIVHSRLVKLVNGNVDPCPLSWCTLPKTRHQNPVTIKCSAAINIDLSNALFEIQESKRLAPICPVLVDESLLSLEDLFKTGRFKRPSRESTMPSGNSAEDKDRPTASEETFWTQYGSTKSEQEFKNSSNEKTVLENSCNSATNSPADDQLVIKNMQGQKKRDRTGDKKRNDKVEAVDTQNVLQKTSSQQSLTVAEVSSNFSGNSNVLPLGKTNKTTQMTYFSMASGFGNVPGGSLVPAMAIESSDQLNTINPSNKMPLTMYRPFIQPARTQSTAMFENKNILLPLSTEIRSQTLTIGNPSKQPFNTSTSAISSLITLQPKWRLDVKLSFDKFEPNLTRVFCHQQISIVVSDSRNSKVKIFSTKGEFVRCMDVKHVGRAIQVSNILIHSTKNKVGGRTEDGSVIKTIIFENKCVVTYLPKRNILVAWENKIRQYAIDKRTNNFVRTNTIAIEDEYVRQIVDIRCDMSGNKLVVIDSNTKSVVILTVNGQIIGTYVEKDNCVWSPTSACFDKNGNVFITDGGGNRLVLLNETGTYIQQWDTSAVCRPAFVATNHMQPLYLTGNDRFVHAYDYEYLQA